MMVVPGKLIVGEPSRDELNADRLKVNVAFTLQPGSYATLVVKRLFWWTLEPKPPRKPEVRPKVRTAAQIHEERKKTGFLARKRARQEARGKAKR